MSFWTARALSPEVPPAEPLPSYSSKNATLRSTKDGQPHFAEATLSIVDHHGSKKNYIVVRKRKSGWPILLLFMRLIQTAFSVVVLSLATAYLFTPANGDVPAKCNLFMQLTYPSDGLTVVYSDGATTDGSVPACDFTIATAAIALFFGIIFFVDHILIVMEYYVTERKKSVSIVHTFITFSVACLWTALAVVDVLGYVTTCTNNRCGMSQNDGIFPNQGATLAVVVFIWLSIVPWGIDAGLLIRYLVKHSKKENELELIGAIEPLTVPASPTSHGSSILPSSGQSGTGTSAAPRLGNTSR